MDFSRIYSKNTVENALEKKKKNELICRCQGHMVCSPAFGSSPARDRDLLPHSVVASGGMADSIFPVRYQLLWRSRGSLPVFAPPCGEERSPLHGDTGTRTLSAEFPQVELESGA